MKIWHLTLITLILGLPWSCRKDINYSCEESADTVLVMTTNGTYTYSADGKLLEVKKKNFFYGGYNTSTYKYDEDGMLKKISSSFASGVSWNKTNIYRSGNICARTFDYEGNFTLPLDTTYFWINNELDYLGYQIDTAFYAINGLLDSIVSSYQVYKFEYNSSGLLTKVIIESDGSFYKNYLYSYNEDGLLSEYKIGGNIPENYTTYQYSYNSCNQLALITTFDGSENGNVQKHFVRQIGIGTLANMNPSKFWRQKYLGYSPITP